MVKAFTICTSEHLSMANDLKSSIRDHCNIELEIFQCDLPSGEFMTSEFYEVQKFKIQTLINNFKDKSYSFIIYLDADIVIRGDAISAMCKMIGDHDICFQRDRTSFCCGMFIAKNNEKNFLFFNRVLNCLDAFSEKYIYTAADQTIVNEMLTLEENDLKYGFLDDSFTTYGNINTEAKLWQGEEFLLDTNVVAFHANFTIGIESKVKLIKYVRSL